MPIINNLKPLPPYTYEKSLQVNTWVHSKKGGILQTFDNIPINYPSEVNVTYGREAIKAFKNVVVIQIRISDDVKKWVSPL